jgi:hypothetical protein
MLKRIQYGTHKTISLKYMLVRSLFVEIENTEKSP